MSISHNPSSESPGTVILLNRDLFSGVGIVNTIRAIGLLPIRVGDEIAFKSHLDARDPKAALGIIDLNGGIDWAILDASLAEPHCPPVVAFGPHVDVEGRRAAKAAGVTRLISNGEFHREMAVVIERYARSGERR